MRVQAVYHMDDIWIGPWAIFPQYMDSTLLEIKHFGEALVFCQQVDPCYSFLLNRKSK